MRSDPALDAFLAEKAARRGFLTKSCESIPERLLAIFDLDRTVGEESDWKRICQPTEEMDALGREFLHWAAMNGDLSVFQLCWDNAKQAAATGQRPAAVATGRGFTGLGGLIRRPPQPALGDKMAVKTKLGWTVSHCAAFGGSVEVLKLTIQNGGGDLKARTLKGQSLLHVAALGKNLPTLQYLVTLDGMSLDDPDVKGATAKHLIRQFGHKDCVAWLNALEGREVGSTAPQGPSSGVDGSLSAASDPERDFDGFPWFKGDLGKLVEEVRLQTVESRNGEGYFVILRFPLALVGGDDPGVLLIKAVQEAQINETQVGGSSSLATVWRRDQKFREALLKHPDPINQGKWDLAKEYGYRIPTTFVPALASALYRLFSSWIGRSDLKVLDPCAGWGDRIVGAACSGVVTEYVGVDPNASLFPGYQRLMGALQCNQFNKKPSATAASPKSMTATTIMQCFEESYVAPQHYDVIFTSPPFFELEVYSELNPQYKDWNKEFYEPMVKLCQRGLKADGVLAIHIDDSSAGTVPPIIQSLCIGKVGIEGRFSKRIATVWILQRPGHASSDGSGGASSVSGEDRTRKRPRE
jgi:hypothetical protein